MELTQENKAQQTVLLCTMDMQKHGNVTLLTLANKFTTTQQRSIKNVEWPKKWSLTYE